MHCVEVHIDTLSIVCCTSLCYVVLLLSTNMCLKTFGSRGWCCFACELWGEPQQQNSIWVKPNHTISRLGCWPPTGPLASNESRLMLVLAGRCLSWKNLAQLIFCSHGAPAGTIQDIFIIFYNYLYKSVNWSWIMQEIDRTSTTQYNIS